MARPARRLERAKSALVGDSYGRGEPRGRRHAASLLEMSKWHQALDKEIKAIGASKVSAAWEI